MTLDTNGYSTAFRTFVEFAQNTQRDGHDSASAKATLEGRQLTVSAFSLHETSALLRKQSEKDVNDATRTLFRNAIVEMFGGEANIPAAVKKAMLQGDYGCGRPLTSRRILAVKRAIDADGTMREKGVSQFANPAIRDAALAKGYRPHELPGLAKAVHFFAEAMGLSEEAALEAVSAPGSKANRLMNYGGRFLKSAGDFADGLRLLDLFEQWHNDLSTAAETMYNTSRHRDERDYAVADTPTKLNVEFSAVSPECRLQMESFVFEDLAINSNANLKETSAEAIFGAANNSVTRFVGQDCGKSSWNTLAQIPPEKRAVVLRAFNQLCRLALNEEDARTGAQVRYFDSATSKLIISRMLKNLDQLTELDRRGRLSAENIVKACIPEMADADNFETEAIAACLDDVYDELGDDLENAAAFQTTMEATGCTLDEVREAMQNTQMLPRVPYYSDVQQELKYLGTVEGGRKQMENDLDRPSNYERLNAPGQGLLQMDGRVNGFGISFAGGERFTTNGTQEGRENIKRIADKIEAMCGAVHPRQASSVMMMLTQSGMSAIVNGLRMHQFKASEHSVLDFSISQDAATGDVTIRYSSPEGLPFAFERSATVRTDGSIVSTPLRFMDENAVNAFNAELATASHDIKTFLASVRNDQAEEQSNATDAVLREVRRDPELLRMLKKGNFAALKSIMLDNANMVRPAAEISSRLETLRGNLNELRIATVGNQRLFELLAAQLEQACGKALPPGTIPGIFEAVRSFDLSAFQNLSAASSPVNIAKALCAFEKGINHVCRETGVLTALGGNANIGPEVRTAINGIVLTLICDRCGEDTLRGLKAAFASQNCGKVIAALDSMADEVFPEGTVRQPNVETVIVRTARGLGEMGSTRWGVIAAINQALEQPYEDNYPKDVAPSNAEFKTVYRVFEDYAVAAQRNYVSINPQ